MSYKEVTQLRLNGQLDEALEMANADLENDKSAWSYRALFWVLHAQCKQHLSDGQDDQASELVEQMKEILPNMEEEQDSIAIKQLDFLEMQLMPHSAIIKQADQDSRDDRKVDSAFDSIKGVLNDETLELDDFQQRTVGWIIYRYAKHALERKQAYNVRLALSLYFKLNVERPSTLHSSILRIAVGLEGEFKNEFKFTAFFKMWGFDQFIDEDWEQFKTEDGKKLPSLAEKAIGRYCKELVDDHIGDVPDEFVALIEKARGKFRGDGKIELNYARMLVARGDTDRAINAYRKVTEKIPQAYVWQELAEVIDDREIKQAILCKVITMQRDEQFLGDTRLKLASQLIDEGNYSAAKHELDTYYQARQARGWNVKPPFNELARRIPAGTQATASNKTLYQSKLGRLTAFLYPDVKATVMFYNGKTFNNKFGKKRAKLIMSDGRSIQIAPNKLPQQRRQPYYFYTVKYTKTDRGLEPLEIIPLDTQEGMKHFEIISGAVRINTNKAGKAFGFVGDCYIHQSLLGNVTNCQQLQVLATKEKDGRLNAAALLTHQIVHQIGE